MVELLRRAILAAALLPLSCTTTDGVNTRPTASTPVGAAVGVADSAYAYASTPNDPDGDSVSLRMDWGDGDTSEWTALAPGGTTTEVSHSWLWGDTFAVRAQALDSRSALSEWSATTTVAVGGPSPFPRIVVDSVESSEGFDMLAVLPNGQFAFGACADHLYKIRTSDNEVVDSVIAGYMLYDICADPAGEYVYAASYGEDCINIIRVADNQYVGDILLPGSPSMVRAAPNGAWLYVIVERPWEQILYELRLADSTVVDSLLFPTSEAYWVQVVVSRDGSRLYALDDDQKLYVVSIPGLEVVDEITVDDCPEDMVQLPDGRLCVVSCEAEALNIVDPVRREVERVLLPDCYPLRLSITAAGDYLYVHAFDWPGTLVLRLPGVVPLAVLERGDMEELLDYGVGLPDGRMYFCSDECRILVLARVGDGRPLLRRTLPQ
jgi:DNA-binding beta-propeller fold protein YncE